MTQRSFENSQLIDAWTKVIFRVSGAALLVLGIVWLVYELRTLLLLLIISIFFCYFIAPLVRVFEQPLYIGRKELRIPRSLAIFLVYAMIGALSFFGVRMLWPQFTDQLAELRQNWDAYIRSGSDAANNLVNGTNTWMRHVKLPIQWREYLSEHLGELAKSSLPILESIVGSIVTSVPYLSWLIVVPILSFFLLRDAESFTNTAVALLPNERLQRRARWLLLDVSKTMAAYIRAQFTSCLFIGAVSTIGLYIFDAPYPALLGPVLGVFEFVPMAGPLLGGCIAFLLSLTVSFKTAVWVGLFLIVLRIVQDYIVYPKIVGHGIKMHPLIVILAIFAGAEIGGLVGIFLSIPVVGLVMVAYHHYVAYRGIQNLRIVVPSEEALEQAEVPIKATDAASRLE
ncbi:MAG TPA: AI-2E family transporter [Blastocatellia bacterium]|nr:AI-2E family transporter [Blastocatellia bacterium]